MKQENCLYPPCGKKLIHTEGRRPKMYCDGNCRQKHYQSEKKKAPPSDAQIKASAPKELKGPSPLAKEAAVRSKKSIKETILEKDKKNAIATGDIDKILQTAANHGKEVFKRHQKNRIAIAPYPDGTELKRKTVDESGLLPGGFGQIQVSGGGTAEITSVLKKNDGSLEIQITGNTDCPPPPKVEATFVFRPNKAEIEAQIKAIKEEKIPKERDTVMGRKSWALDQKKRIEELEKQLK